jgi:HSP20 family protein
MTITRWRPLGDLVSMREAMDRLFDDFVRPGTWSEGMGALSVPVDLWEEKDAYRLRADVPGMKPDDIEINVTHDTVTISGEMKTEIEAKEEGWLRQERRTGKFSRSFSLPVEIDANKVDATFENGVLQLTLPKSEAVRPKQIRVRSTVAGK